MLIADDEMIERAVLYKMLNKNLEGQCEIYQAENGRQALELYEKEKIQIAVLDIEMPGINGIQAAEKIREKDKDCVIIFLTAFDEFAYAKKAITVRALDYLLKPWDEKELMLKLEKLPKQEIAAIKAVILENKKCVEAALELGMSVNTLKTHLARALKKLRKDYHLSFLFYSF